MRRSLPILLLLICCGIYPVLRAQTFSEPRLLPFSSPVAEFGAIWYADGILFASERNNSDAGVTHVERLSGQFLSDLYFSKRKDSLRWSSTSNFSSFLNTNFHEGPVAIGPDSASLFLVRSLRLPSGRRQNENAPLSEILFVEKNKKGWMQPQRLVLGPTATYTDPFLSPDGGWLYFASDMPGGIGSLDLYRIPWPLDGSPAQNLGPDINSPSAERYPFLDADNYFFFSSAKPGGMGGYDLYQSRRMRSSWSKALSLPAPLNTEFDDFGLALSPDGSEGSFVSNRKNGGLDDDLYYFTLARTDSLECQPQQRNAYCFDLYEEGSLELPLSSLYYQWDLGDGTAAKGSQVYHCFPGPGDYNISLAVYDSLTGLPVFVQTEYLLELRDAVQAYISGADSIPVGSEGKWDAKASNLPGFEPARFAWDFGDGESAEGEEVEHVYAVAGIYEMQLAVYGSSLSEPERTYHCVTRSIAVGERGSPLADSYKRPDPDKVNRVDSVSILNQKGSGNPLPAVRSRPSLDQIAGYKGLPKTYFKVQAGTSPLAVKRPELSDGRLRELEKIKDGEQYRYLLPDSLGLDGAMQKLGELREMGFPKPAILVFRGDTMLPRQPFLDHWIPADSFGYAVVRGIVSDRKQMPLGGTVVWENLGTGEVLLETPVNEGDGSFEQVLPKDIFYGYFVDLEGYYSISKHLDLREYTGDLVVETTMEMLSLREIVQEHIPVRINNLFFDYDKYDIRSESHQELYRLVRFLLEHPEMHIEVAGHTDSDGSPDYNEALSRKRAGSVARFLVLSGCDPENITAQGYGEARPVAPNNSPEGRQLNRRVEFSILSE